MRPLSSRPFQVKRVRDRVRAAHHVAPGGQRGHDLPRLIDHVDVDVVGAMQQIERDLHLLEVDRLAVDLADDAGRGG